MAKLDAWFALVRRSAIVTGAALLALLTISPAISASASSIRAVKGTVDVIFDSSLTDAMALLAPAFQKATGFAMLQTAGGSGASAAAILGKTTKQDVFVSQGASAQKSLEGGKGGSWVSWYAQVASTPLLLAYTPTSKFAKDLRTMPWYKVITLPGFKFGRIDPASAPAGGLAVDELNSAAKTEKLPALSALATSQNDVFSESDLIANIRSGKVTAGFLYGVDAVTARFKTVTPTTSHFAVSYMLSILRGTTDQAAAVAFVRFLVSSHAAGILKKQGVAIEVSPTLAGPRAAVPAALRTLF